MFEAAAVGSLLAGGPIVAILGMIYNVIILGPTGFLGSAVFILFYPALVSKPPCYSLVASPWIIYFSWVLYSRYHSGITSLIRNLLKAGSWFGKAYEKLDSVQSIQAEF